MRKRLRIVCGSMRVKKESWRGLERARKIAMDRLINSILDTMVYRGVNRAELAKRMGCSKAYVTQMLRGNKSFTIDTISKIGHALDCEPKIILTENTHENDQNVSG